MSERKRTISANLQTNLIAGVLTVIPIVVVWLVLNFVFAVLFQVGAPLAHALTTFITGRAPDLTPVLRDPVFQWFVAVVVALLLLYVIGATASRVVGKRLIANIEAWIERIPFVQTIYSASKKLVSALQQKPEGVERVVLIDFPHPGVKAIGLVTRTFKDAATGEEVAAVYVPTTPNPTSGYLALVPVRDVLPTALTMDQAMTMIVSGGAIAPPGITTGRVAAPERRPAPEPSMREPN